MGLSADLLVERMEPGGPADISGVQVGMRLVSFQGASTQQLSSDETRRRMSGTPRPWTLVFDKIDSAGSNNTRTIFDLVQQIKQEVGLCVPVCTAPLLRTIAMFGRPRWSAM